MRIVRVFPRRTNATPTDTLSVVNRTPGFFDEADAVHISVTWTWDLPQAERLSKAWAHVAPVTIGGPATGDPGGDFTPGMYVKPGYVITSRGCPNRCWFCSVWKREGTIRELPIMPGWNILDDNLLACSEAHIRAVFTMLSTQRQAAQFTGGLEAARMQPWIAQELRALRPKQVFFAYDTASDFEPLVEAVRMMFDAGFTRSSHAVRCYVLIGYPGDTVDKAEERLRQTVALGLVPMAMLYRNYDGHREESWMRFQRIWARPSIICGERSEP